MPSKSPFHKFRFLFPLGFGQGLAKVLNCLNNILMVWLKELIYMKMWLTGIHHKLSLTMASNYETKKR